MRLKIVVEPYHRFRDWEGYEFRIVIESPELPDGKVTLFQDIEISEFESVFDVTWQRAYEVLKRQIGKHLVEKKEATKWAEVG